jgi:transcription elongation factor GreA
VFGVIFRTTTQEGKMATAQQASKQVYLTRQGLQDVKGELEFLKTDKRLQLAKRLQDAREMDNTEENAEYDAAMTDQELVENRISELEKLIRQAKVIDHSTSAPSQIITIGSTVTLETKDGVEEFTIVGRTEANPAKKKISNESPLGSSLLGAKKGDTVSVSTQILSYQCKVLEIK